MKKKHLKEWSASLADHEMQTKMNPEWVNLKSQVTDNADEDLEQGEHFSIAGRSTHFYSPSEVYIYIEIIISQKYHLLLIIAHMHFIYYI